MREDLTPVKIIELHPHTVMCFACDEETVSLQALAVYEDSIVPDDYAGQWGGAPACHRCYYIARGLQAENPGKPVAANLVRAIASGVA